MTNSLSSSYRPTFINHPRSQAAYEAARRVIPGGVNSPVRAFTAVGGDPLFIDHGAGSHLWDIDGNEYVDYVLSWGPLILGHAHPAVIAAITEAAAAGTSFGAPTERETALAEHITSLVPGAESIRFVSSGTEATMSAIRLARAATGRPKLIKFHGCYHGHADLLLVQAGSGVATLGLPNSPGVPASATADTLVARYNDLASVEALMTTNREQIAAVIVEPVAGNMGLVLPEPDFLKGLRQLTQQAGALLIFDEVLSGFRVALGGATSLYDMTPDLITLGKVVGGGLPLAAYAGCRELMELVAPTGAVYQAGTLSGNPLATSAGLATLRLLEEPGVFDAIAARTQRLADGLRTIGRDRSIPIHVTQVGSLAGVFFTDRPVRNYDDAGTANTERFARYFRGMLDRGIYLAPSQFEVMFLSAAHTDADIDRTLAATADVMASL